MSRWEPSDQLPPLNEPRKCHSSICLGQKLYVYGGTCDLRWPMTLNSIEILDMSSRVGYGADLIEPSWMMYSAREMVPRFDARLCAVDDSHIMIAGGTVYDPDVPKQFRDTGEVWIFDTEKK